MNDGKTFLCVVCGEQVSKRQSLAYTKDGKVGRACRKHPEVMREMQERLSAEETKRQQDLERKMREKSRRLHAHDAGWREHFPTGPVCWHCKKEGIHAQQHFLRMMIANEKCALQGTSFLDRQAFKEAYGKVDPVLVFVKVWEGHDLVKRTREGDMLWSMAGGDMFVCRECAEKFNLLPEWEKALQPTDITPEMLKAMMAISELLPITHAVRAAAKLEVAADKQMIPVFGETTQEGASV